MWWRRPAAHGTYGDFTIDADGAWTYAGNGAHDELTAGQQVQDQFTVTSQDGTATGTVTVTITGTNDAATVSSDSKSVTEGDTAAALNTSGAADDHRPGHGRGACGGADQLRTAPMATSRSTPTGPGPMPATARTTS